ncbi:MAG: glycosyltransferase family 4 protein [Candidatus Aureabacteria bacterium]|nr:glycosyltransferase family 4 protein [Candidatus Auribacterota bacterium]
MKILVIAPEPFFTVRGTVLAVRDLATSLCRRGHSVDILTFHLGDDVAEPNLRIVRTSLFSKHIAAIPPGFSGGKLALDMVLIPRALYLILTGRYDIVHCVEESAYFISFFKWIRRFLFIYDMDSDIPHQLEYSGKIRSRVLFRLARWIERYAIRRADAVVTISNNFTESVHAIAPGKTVIQIEDVSVCEELPPARPHEGAIILYTGNFQPYQGVELLIEGFGKIQDRFPSAHLVLAGGEPAEIEGLKNRYAGVRLRFTGKRPMAEMPRLMADADILASPRSQGENTPYKIYSYLAAGKPLLATRIISHTEVLTDGVDSLLVEPTPDSIAGGLAALLGDPSLARRLGAGARKLFDARYSRERYEEKVDRLCNFMEKNCR